MNMKATWRLRNTKEQQRNFINSQHEPTEIMRNFQVQNCGERKSAWFIKSQTNVCRQQKRIWSYVMWNIINLFTVLFVLRGSRIWNVRFITDLCLLISHVFDLDFKSSFAFVLPQANKEIEKIWKTLRESTCVTSLECAFCIQSSFNLDRDETRTWLRCVHKTFVFIELRKLIVNICWPIGGWKGTWNVVTHRNHKYRVIIFELTLMKARVPMQKSKKPPDNLCYMIIWVIHFAFHGFSTWRRILLMRIFHNEMV